MPETYCPLQKNQYILLTGGCGYIGSHILKCLLESSHLVIVLDNLSNSSEESLKRVERMTGKVNKVIFIKGDIRDKTLLINVFEKYPIRSVIHCAGLKSVGQSNEKPIEYHDCNVNGTLCLLDIMDKYDVKKLIFSSSATVYGNAPTPLTEKSQTGIGITNPYGRSKYLVEEILKDCVKSSVFGSNMNKLPWNIIVLRYFNPIGADSSGQIGEDPNDIPNNLMPYISQVCIQKRPYLTIFGDNYDTIDGTGVRDYIHVSDLASGHLAALRKLDSLSQSDSPKPEINFYNLGTGNGYSVLQIVQSMEKQIGKKIPYKIGKRRSGDLGEVYCSPNLANEELNWKCEKTIDDCCRDAWKWKYVNPNGYKNIDENNNQKLN